MQLVHRAPQLLQVMYDAAQFLEKNRDNLSKNVMHLLRNTENELLSTLFIPSEERSQNASISSTKSRTLKSQDMKLSVSAHFKNSLLDLMDKMLAATPHFIRCAQAAVTCCCSHGAGASSPTSGRRRFSATTLPC